MTTPPLDPQALRKTAEAATPGPWESKQGAIAPGKKVVGPRESNDLGRGPIVLMQPIFWDKRSAANADHIAAFNPTTVLALLDRVTAAESSLARYIVERTRFGDAMAANAVAPVVDAIMRELTADSAARAEAAEKKVAAVRELRNVWFRELENADHLVPLEDVIDATDDALGGSA